MCITLKSCFSDPLLSVMNFLNEVTRDFPDAISFATGSPMESLFDVGGGIRAIDWFVEERVRITGLDREMVLNDLGQYNRTNGIINDAIARYLAIDESIRVPPLAVMVTTGAQEAMSILMMGLFEPGEDALLVAEPAYIGITGLASILGVQVISVPSGAGGLELDALTAAIENTRRLGKRPRAVYDVPDFNNPLGTSMPIATRHAVLELAHANGLLVFEDNPYGMFDYDGDGPPTLKALDKERVVVYLGTFSKTLFPELRIGFLVADQEVVGGTHLLAEELSKIKGFTTVNTSSLLQAAVAGILASTNYSLRPHMEEKLAFYRVNRDRIMARLMEEFGGPDFRGLVRWRRPSGGFFLTLELPFVFDRETFYTCASVYGLLCCPVSFFLPGQAPDNRVRLSFSYVTPDQIDEGVRRLGRFVRDRLGR